MARLPAGRPRHPGAAANGSIGWLSSAVEDFRVLLLDQRGTGRSTPANRQTLRDSGASGEDEVAAGLSLGLLAEGCGHAIGEGDPGAAAVGFGCG